MRWLALLWVALALAFTAALGRIGAFAGHWPEQFHFLGHFGLCGGLAFIVAAAWRGSEASRACAGVAAAVALGVAIELVQLRLNPPWHEAGFDVCLDTVGAIIGVLLHGGRATGPGHVASAVLHPLFVAPLGFTMAVFAVSREPGFALGWATIAMLCVTPAVVVWLAGIRGGWWSDADLSRRTDRGPLFAVGCLCAVGFWLVASAGPPPLPQLARVAIAGAVLGTAWTLSGLKVSGHVAIPAAIGLMVVGASPRAASLLLVIALVLSWARVVAGRHRAVEVVAGWGLAAMVTLLAPG